MGVFDEINVKITGQIKPIGEGRIVMARLKLICAEYDLEIEEQHNEI